MPFDKTPEGRRKQAVCSARHQLRKKYGIDDVEYLAMRDAQDGKCACCGDDLPPGFKAHVDHDHDTGEVRALLCHGCNVGLGHLKDDPERVRKALEYLTNYEPHSRRLLEYGAKQ